MAKMLRWRISRIRGNKPQLLGVVTAATEAAAIATTVEKHRISDPEKIARLTARREDA